MRNGDQVVTMRDGEQNANTGKVVAMASQKCTVTIGGLGDPAEHVVTVEGDTLYEAAVRGWKALREGRWSGDECFGYRRARGDRAAASCGAPGEGDGPSRLAGWRRKKSRRSNAPSALEGVT